ncbi:LGFP repeat-containing protein [Nocardia huaxiensis]|nr:hypothetical protein [Nocardia huaxiensis]UFT00427.1 hypothetical protein LPY97_07995 [Nocardia huaxiensis]
MYTFERKSFSHCVSTGAFLGIIGLGLLGGPAIPAWADPPARAVEAIDHRYAEFGGAGSFLGTPLAAASDIGTGAERNYQGGTIFYSPDHGAKIMYGDILEKYRALGGPAGPLGFPVNDESVADGGGRFNDFAQPGGAAIYWSPASGAWLVRGPVLDAYKASGGVTGPFGYPASDTDTRDGVEAGRFSGPGGTEISWSQERGLTTDPAALAATLPGFKAIQGNAMFEPEGNGGPGFPSVSVPKPNIAVPQVNTGGGINRWWGIPIGLAATAAAASLLRLFGPRRGDGITSIAMSGPATPKPAMRTEVPRPVPSVNTSVPAPKPRGTHPRELPREYETPQTRSLSRFTGAPPAGKPQPNPTGRQVLKGSAQEPARPRHALPETVVPEADPLYLTRDAGGIDVFYENNAIGINQRSVVDKSDP